LILPLAKQVEQTIIACVRNARGAEICGYLVEDPHGNQSFLAIENRLASRDGVFASKLDIARAQRQIRARDLRICAWVHSHYSGTSLSEIDRLGLAESDVPWIVVCLTELGLDAACYVPDNEIEPDLTDKS